MDTNDYKQKLMDLLVLEMGKKRLFDNSGLKKFVAITAETLQKNKTTDFTDALFQVTNFAFSVGFNEGLQHSMELMNKVEIRNTLSEETDMENPRQLKEE